MTGAPAQPVESTARVTRVPLAIAVALAMGAMGFGVALVVRPVASVGKSGLVKPRVAANPVSPPLEESDCGGVGPLGGESLQGSTSDENHPEQLQALEPFDIGARVATLEPDVLTPRPGEGTGALSIESTPSAEVFLDRLPMQRSTPVRRLQVWAGRHRLGLRTPDGVMHDFAVEVVAGETTAVVKDLTQAGPSSAPTLNLFDAQQVIRSDPEQFTPCMVVPNANSSGAHYPLVIEVVVIDGVPETAEVSTSLLRDAESEGCVLQRALQWRFEEGHSGRITVPFQLVPIRVRRREPQRVTDSTPW